MSAICYSGYLDEVSGFGVAARNHIAALRGQGVDVVSDGECDRVIIHALPCHYFRYHQRGRYNISFTALESSRIPISWPHHLEQADEHWVPSHFCAEAMTAGGLAPVFVCPHPVMLEAQPAADRRFPGIPDDMFLFASILEWSDRKNPLGLLRCFRRAFQGRSDVGLLLKVGTSLAPPRAVLYHVQRMTLGLGSWRCPPVFVVFEDLDAGALSAFYGRADAYVSLHRSEGFGLTLAEAMLAGKPVVATGYSGNMDFMSEDSAYLVGHELVPVVQRLSHWKDLHGGMVWAEPDEEQAVEQLRRCEGDAAHRQRVADRGRRLVEECLNPEKIGRMMCRMLELGPR